MMIYTPVCYGVYGKSDRVLTLALDPNVHKSGDKNPWAFFFYVFVSDGFCEMANEKVLKLNLTLWRICNFIMSGFFSLAAYVQINDPDAGLWMVGYTIPAGLCFLISFRPQITETLVWRRVADLHVMMATAFGALLGCSLYKHGVTHIFHQEEGREFCGLMLMVMWLLMCRHSGRSGVGALRLCTAVAITAFPIITWIYYYIHKELRADWPSHCTTTL